MTRDLGHLPSGDVATWRDGHAGGIVLDRPRAINALTLDMVVDITHALDRFAEDDAVHTVVISGEGRGLCAGGDMKAIRGLVVDASPQPGAFFAREYEMNARIDTYPKPLVAIVDGIVMGGGVGLSAHASHRIVTERSVLAMPEVAIGFAPDVGSTWLLAHAPGHLGIYVGLTGARLDAGDAIHLGLADHVVASADLDVLLDALCVEGPSAAIDRLASTRPLTSALAAEQPWIDHGFAADTVVGITDRLDAIGSPAAAGARDDLLAGSPTALVATFEALRYGRAATRLDDCLRNEFRVGTAMIGTHDFLEGTRAVLVDKDGDPQWDPADLTPAVEEQVGAWIREVEASEAGPQL